jgi:hypothetical protein
VNHLGTLIPSRGGFIIVFAADLDQRRPKRVFAMKRTLCRPTKIADRKLSKYFVILWEPFRELGVKGY